MNGRLAGKVAVVTGGASGIGEAIVRRFVEEGARLVIADIDDEGGRVLSGALGEAAEYVRTDVTDESAVAAAVRVAVERFGRLDCMVNNAGLIGPLASITDISGDDFDRAYAILVRGVMFGIKHAARVMIDQGSGSIINTASIAALLNGYGPHIYNSAKGAVVVLTRSAAMELGPKGVRVNSICPGGIVTPMAASKLGGGARGHAAATRLYQAFQPIRRAGQPEDIANAALWLASDEASFVNAAAIVIDGGASGGQQWSPMFESEPSAEWIASLHADQPENAL